MVHKQGEKIHPQELSLRTGFTKDFNIKYVQRSKENHVQKAKENI
jgi:hypothetical protein